MSSRKYSTIFLADKTFINGGGKFHMEKNYEKKVFTSSHYQE
jgi:hypothetical protein